MNLNSFVDELVKLGSVPRFFKRSADMANADIPGGMMSGAPVPASIRVAPDEAGTRLIGNSQPSIVSSGSLGSVSEAAKPIDQEGYNRQYKVRR